jgi:hypothetical protein
MHAPSNAWSYWLRYDSYYYLTKQLLYISLIELVIMITPRKPL